MDLAKPSLAMPMGNVQAMQSPAFASRTLQPPGSDSLHFGARTPARPRKVGRLASIVLLLLGLGAGKVVMDNFNILETSRPAARSGMPGSSTTAGQITIGSHRSPTPTPSGRPSRADRNAARDIRQDLKNLNFYNHQEIALAIGEVQNPRLKAELIMDYLDAAAGEGHNAALYGTAVSVYFLEYGGRAQTLLWHYGNLPNNAAVRAGARADILAEIP